jgi:hypothetical protein
MQKPGREVGKVIGNIVLNGMGDLNGRKEEDRNSRYAGNVHGIYLDNGTTDVDILIIRLQIVLQAALS